MLQGLAYLGAGLTLCKNKQMMLYEYKLFVLCQHKPIMLSGIYSEITSPPAIPLLFSVPSGPRYPPVG